MELRFFLFFQGGFGSPEDLARLRWYQARMIAWTRRLAPSTFIIRFRL